MFEHIPLLGGGAGRPSAGYAAAAVRTLGGDTELESRVACSVTNVAVQGAQLVVNGEPTRLVMYGTYGMIEPGFDHAAFFDSLRGYNVNAVRLWVNFHWANELSPFARDAATGRYDLKTWSTTYFDRLKNFVAEADKRGVVVQLCLFDGVMLETGKPNRWNWSPYNDVRNTDGTAYLSTAQRFSGFFSTTGSVWADVNRPLIDKVAAEFGDFGNVIYEVMNEPTAIEGFNPADNQPTIKTFHEAVAARLKGDLQYRAGSKVVSVNAGTSGPLYNWASTSGNVDVVSVHLSGKGLSDAAALGSAGKPVVISNDGHNSCFATSQSPDYGTNTNGTPKTRAQLTQEIAAATFAGETASRYGSRHFEFLDLGMYGGTHGSGSSSTPPNYNASTARTDPAVLSVLSGFGRPAAARPAGGFRADFTGDGRPDLAVWRPATGNWYIQNLVTGQGQTVQWGVPGDIPTFGNFLGDARADLAVWRPADGNWYILNLATGQGQTVQWGLRGDIPVPADFDGDGRTELAVWRPLTGTWYVRNLATGQTAEYQWGLPGDVPVPGNYLGNARPELAVWRPTEGNWYVWDLQTGQRSQFQWGLPGDVPVPADFDGDGRLELAVWRPATGTWFVKNPVTGQTAEYQWGLPGDIPVPGDYDGDGRTDLAVWRPATGMWHTKSLVTGQTRAIQWGLFGDRPLF